MPTLEKRQLISIVTPCYNEAGNVEEHFRRVRAALEPFKDKYDFEHVYTDNQSADETFSILKSMGIKHPNLKVLRFSRNIGATRAVLMGLEYAKGDAVVLIQGDLQDPPEMIGQFIQKWQEGYDVVFGQITGREEGFVIQRLRALYYKIISWMADVTVPENAGDFRLTSRRALDGLLSFRDPELYIRGTVAEVGFKQIAIPFMRADRKAGRSSANLPYLLSFAINGLFSTATVRPIRAVTLAGVVVSALGFLGTFVFVLGKILLPSAAPRGFTTLAILLTFFSGVQLLAIGVIGEYLRKIYVHALRPTRGFVQEGVNLD